MKRKKMWIVIAILLISLFLILCLVFRKKDNQQDPNIVNMKEAIENVFYYLPDNEYDDMNKISDYCKLSLIYDTDYLGSDYKIYDDGKKISSYTKNNILSSIKTVLGKDAYLDFNKSENGDYNFIMPDDCKFSNNYNLTYDEQRQIVYELQKDNSNRKLFVKWQDSEENGNTIILRAKALMAVKSDSGYDLYVDYNMNNLIGSYNNLKEIEKDLDDNYFKSYDYEFRILKEDNNYIWKSYKRNVDEEYIIYD